MSSRRGQVILPLLLGMPVAGVSVLMAFQSLAPGRAGLMTAGIIATHVSVVWRRRAPMAALGLCCSGVLTMAATTGLFIIVPTTAIFPLMLYWVCLWGPRRYASGAAALAGGFGAVATTVRFTTDSSVTQAGWEPTAWAVLAVLTAVVITAVALGLLRRAQLAYVRLLERERQLAETARLAAAEHAVQADRRRIARDLHDVVSHSLVAMVSQAQGARYLNDGPRTAEVLVTIEETGRRALNDMRAMLGVLRWNSEDGPARVALPRLSDVDTLVERARENGLPVSLEQTGTPAPIGTPAEVAGYRLVQESLTNVMKHAGADATTSVRLAWKPDGLQVVVHNDTGSVNGDGDDGYGLTGIRERITAAGGEFTAGGEPGGGFTVSARLPHIATTVDRSAP